MRDTRDTVRSAPVVFAVTAVRAGVVVVARDTVTVRDLFVGVVVRDTETRCAVVVGRAATFRDVVAFVRGDAFEVFPRTDVPRV